MGTDAFKEHHLVVRLPYRQPVAGIGNVTLAAPGPASDQAVHVVAAFENPHRLEGGVFSSTGPTSFSSSSKSHLRRLAFFEVSEKAPENLAVSPPVKSSSPRRARRH